MIHWLAAFAITQLVEVPIYMRALKGHFGVAFAASAFTHPFVWFGFPVLARHYGIGYRDIVLCMELFAVTFEAIWLHHHDVKRPLLWSLAANASSVAIGLTIRHFFGWP
jgi:hypothetical protein